MRALIIVAALSAFAPAKAGVIYDFSGVVTETTSNNDDLSGVALGAVISGWFEYDIDRMTPLSDGTTYLFGVPDYSLQIGPRTFTPNSGATVQYESDRQLFTDILPRSDNPELFWADETYWMFSGLNGAPPNLDSFDSAMVFLRILTFDEGPSEFKGSATIFGDISSWERRKAVPEPSSLWLFAIGLFGIGALASRRRLRSRTFPALC